MFQKVPTRLTSQKKEQLPEMIIIRIRAIDFRVTVQNRGSDIVFWNTGLWISVTLVNIAVKIWGKSTNSELWQLVKATDLSEDAGEAT